MEHVRLRIPGEVVWAEVKEQWPNGEAVVRIDNVTFAERSDKERAQIMGGWFEGKDDIPPRLHDFKCDDQVTCKLGDDGVYIPTVDHTQTAKH